MDVLGYSGGLSLCTRVSHVCARLQWGTVSVYQGESCVCYSGGLSLCTRVSHGCARL